jgi:hypothetical protein
MSLNVTISFDSGSAERHARGFSCWDQFVAMLFAQLGRAHSLREICGRLGQLRGRKLAHLGVFEGMGSSGPLSAHQSHGVCTKSLRRLYRFERDRIVDGELVKLSIADGVHVEEVLGAVLAHDEPEASILHQPPNLARHRRLALVPLAGLGFEPPLGADYALGIVKLPQDLGRVARRVVVTEAPDRNPLGLCDRRLRQHDNAAQ